MRASLNWLKEYVNIDLTPEELGDALTMAGLEVDRIEEVGRNLNKVIVGRIISIDPHPHADRLSLCKVSTGENQYSIVCGATNMKVGDKIALALEGTILSNGMKIKNTKIRGELSQGMICSEEELGIGEDSSGIMILQDDLELGNDIGSALGLRDYIFELEITPNRSDCLSIIGIAREIAAITGQDLRIPSIEFAEGDKRIDELASVELQDPELCPRYSAGLVMGVTIDSAPFWMRRRLESVGIRPISNVVDITNYVLMEFGQPLHAFDSDLLNETKIVVKRAKNGDLFSSLDGMKRNLFDDTLMICDGEKPVAIGGIMGGLNSEVLENTCNVLIESAHFNPLNIRKTSQKLGLQTEASYRFERGVNPEGVITALNRAIQLMTEICGGESAGGVIDQYPVPISSRNISLSIRRTNKILGTSIRKDKVERYLKSIGLDVRDRDEDTLDIGISPLRMDLVREIDLIEEVARLDGYDNIPTTTPTVKLTSTRRGGAQILEQKTKDILTSLGYYEVVNYSFISPQSIALLKLDTDHPFKRLVRIKNPLSEEQSVMRTTLIPGLLKTMKTNLYNGNMDLKLFEIGTVFNSKKVDELPEEKRMLSALVTGLRYDESWNLSGKGVDYYDIKGTVENLFKGLDVRGLDFSSIGDIPFLHPGKTAGIVVNDTEIGILGEVRSDILEGYELSKTACIVEIDFNSLRKYIFKEKKIAPLSKYPPIFRDIALIVDEKVQAKDIQDCITGLKNRLIEEARIFDVYRGEPLNNGEKSLAYRVKYQSYERTLTDKEINKIHDKLVAKLIAKVGGRIRE